MCRGFYSVHVCPVIKVQRDLCVPSAKLTVLSFESVMTGWQNSASAEDWRAAFPPVKHALVMRIQIRREVWGGKGHAYMHTLMQGFFDRLPHKETHRFVCFSRGRAGNFSTCVHSQARWITNNRLFSLHIARLINVSHCANPGAPVLMYPASC